MTDAEQIRRLRWLSEAEAWLVSARQQLRKSPADRELAWVLLEVSSGVVRTRELLRQAQRQAPASRCLLWVWQPAVHVHCAIQATAMS